MIQSQAKLKIKKLISRYRNLTSQEMKMNEEMTKTKFIRPLFEALGWDFEEDVLLEDKVSRGRVDYNFQLDGHTKFFLEAKPIKADIDDPEYAKQATNYAWLKNISWAVLCDFEGIRIFYPSNSGEARCCLHLNWQQYISDFEDLWMLSKEAFDKNLLEKYAEKSGAKPTKIKVSHQLAEDLNIWRKELYKDFRLANEDELKLSDKELDEGVQKILDRFIFIRACEDRGLEDKSLRSEYRIWQDKGRKGNFLSYLKSLFNEYQKIYNSGLFDYHPCVDWEIFSDTFDQIISGIYKSPSGQNYNFSDIDADVLGAVYEQYLGHLLQKSNGEDSKKKRKSQGIYYTPTFIVDYIVQNTLGKVLKEKSKDEICNLKILDPACGSGSFLIKAYDMLIDYHTKEKNKIKSKGKLRQIRKLLKEKGKIQALTSAQKISILRNNIYGVDLDEQAVEIAQLNLLLETVHSKGKLPHLNNIKCGNSLIDDLKVVGDKAFNWQEQFPFCSPCHSEQSEESGFDIIIGNPPYVNLANINSAKERNYYKNEFESAKNKSDLYSFFTEKALNLLKPNGILGFIVSNSWLGTDSFSKFRKYLIDNSAVYELVKLPNDVFKDATVTPVLIFLKKQKILHDYNINLYGYKNEKFIKLTTDLSYKRINNSPNFSFSFNPEIKLNIPTIKLGTIAKFSLGIKTSNDKRFILDKKKDKNCYKLLRGKDVDRYSFRHAGKWIWYKPKLMMEKVGAGPRKLEYFLKEKIFFKDVAIGISAVYDDKKFLSTDTLSLIYDIDKYDLKFFLSLLNSNFINHWYKINFASGLHIKINELKHIPVPKINFFNPKEKAKHDGLMKLADKMLKLNKDLQKHQESTNKYNRLQSEITRTDKLIDQKVYKLYRLSKKEIEIIEGKSK